jgi:hypothetical protein
MSPDPYVPLTPIFPYFPKSMDHSVKKCRLTPIFRAPLDAQPREREPADPKEREHRKETLQAAKSMDHSVKKCRLTPIFQKHGSFCQEMSPDPYFLLKFRLPVQRVQPACDSSGGVYVFIALVYV